MNRPLHRCVHVHRLTRDPSALSRFALHPVSMVIVLLPTFARMYICLYLSHWLHFFPVGLSYQRISVVSLFAGLTGFWQGFDVVSHQSILFPTFLVQWWERQIRSLMFICLDAQLAIRDQLVPHVWKPLLRFMTKTLFYLQFAAVCTSACVNGGNCTAPNVCTYVFRDHRVCSKTTTSQNREICSITSRK